MPTLHQPQQVFSMRHAPSWMLLALSAGAVNSIAFLACTRFVTHVTGTVTLIGIDAHSTRLALDYTVVLACFVLGAMASATLIDARFHRGRRPLYAIPLVSVALIQSFIGVLGVLGIFGEFGGSVETTLDFAFLSLLAFAMGMQNAAVATSTGNFVRTTHMTGPATDLGVHLATAFHVEGEPRRHALRHAALRAGKIAAFTVGAGIGAYLAKSLAFAAFFVPALIVASATALSFIRVPSTTAQESES